MSIQYKSYLQKLIIRILAAIIILGPFMHGLFSQGDWIIIQVVLGLTFLVDIYKKIATRDVRLRLNYLDVLWLSVIALYFLSIFWGVHRHGAYTTAFRYLSFYLVLHLGVSNIETKEDRNLILFSVVSSAFLNGILALVLSARFPIPGFQVDTGYRVSSTFQYPNTFAAFMSAGFLIGIVLLVSENKIWLRQYLTGALFIMGTGIIVSQSRGNYVIFIALMLLLLAYHILTQKHTTSIIYHFLLITISSLYASGLYYDKIRLKEYSQALFSLGAVLLLLLVISYFTDLILRKLERLNPNAVWKSILMGGIVVYILLVGAFYFNYLLSADPTARSGIIGGNVTQRLTDIDAQESSLVTRMDYNRDAFAIMKAYPFGAGGRGWDSLYHQFQPYEYWSTEVHNHYLQLGVEVGFLGLFLHIASWILVFYMSYRVYRERRNEEDSHIQVGATLALAMLLVHAAVDFDFTFAIMQILAMVIASTVIYREKSRKLRLGEFRPKVYVLKLSLLSAIFLLVLPSTLELASEYHTLRGYRAWDRDGIIEKYEKATQLSPWNDHVKSLLARQYAQRYMDTADNRDYDRVNQLTDRVLQLAPKNIWSLTHLQDAHFILKNQPRLLFLRQQEAMILPVSPHVNAMLGDEYVKTAIYEIRNGNDSQARSHVDTALSVMEPFLNAEKGNPYLKNASVLRPFPYHYLVLGKISHMQGDFTDALRNLQTVKGRTNLAEESILWQMAVHIRAGEPEKAERLLPRISRQERLKELYEIVSLGGILKNPNQKEETHAGYDS